MKIRAHLLGLLGLLLATKLGATVYWFDQPPFLTYAEFDPLPLFTSTGQQAGHTVTALQASQALRFWSHSDHVGIGSYTSTAAGRTYELYQDGTDIASVAFPASGSGSWSTYSFATGLDTLISHLYEIICITPIQGSSSNWFDGWLDLDANGIDPTPVTRRLVYGFYGDSITGVTNATPTISDTRLADEWQAMHATGHQLVIAGVAGGTVVSQGVSNTGNIPAGVDGVVVRYGINDISGGSSDSAFQSAYTTMLQDIRAQIGGSKPIWCYEPCPTATSSTQISRDHYGSLIQAAITASGVSNVTYIPTPNWYPTDATHLPDGTHPNALTYAIYANREIPIFSATAITISGPTTGTSGVASSTFTVTMANGGLWQGDQAVTLTVGSGAITATAASGSISGNGSSAVTVTPANGATSFTFTFTPSASGSFTITPTTTLAGWTMPSGANFTVSASLQPGVPGSSGLFLASLGGAAKSRP